MNSKSENDVKRFNRWAATYEQSAMQKLYFGPIHSRMLELIEKNKPAVPFHDILDVGCGTGRLLRAASSRYPAARLHGIDPAEQMIHEAKRLNPKAIFETGHAEALPFRDDSFDLAFSSISFHHWTDQAKGIREIARVLRSGGLFCLADHTMHLATIFKENVKSRNQIRALLENAGLSVLLQKRLWGRCAAISLARK